MSTGIPCCKNFTITINGTPPDCIPVTPDVFGWYNATAPDVFSPGALITTGLAFPYTLIPAIDQNLTQYVLFIGPFINDSVCDSEKKCPYTITFNFRNDSNNPPAWSGVDPGSNIIPSGVPQSILVGQTFKVLFGPIYALDSNQNRIPFGPEMNMTASVVSNPP